MTRDEEVRAAHNVLANYFSAKNIWLSGHECEEIINMVFDVVDVVKTYREKTLSRYNHIPNWCPECALSAEFIGDTDEGPFKQCRAGHRWFKQGVGKLGNPPALEAGEREFESLLPDQLEG